MFARLLKSEFRIVITKESAKEDARTENESFEQKIFAERMPPDP